MRCSTRAITPAGVCPPWRSRSSWPLKVSLIDSMTCRNGRNRCAPARSGSPLRAGRSSRTPCSVSAASNAPPDLPFVGLGAGKREADRQAVQRADQVQAQPPEVAAVAGAVAVFGPSGQLGAVGGLGRPAALHGGGVAYPHVIGPPGRVAGQHADGPLEQAGGCPQALVVAGLAGQVGKQVAQVPPGVAQPVRLGGKHQQGSDGDGQCGGERVQVGVHRASRLDVGFQRRSWAPSCHPASPQPSLGINRLGAFRVLRAGQPVPVAAWQSKKARTLLKILVARRGRATTRDYLMEVLWPEEPVEVVIRRLSVALATARAVLDPDKRHPPDHFIVADKDALRLLLENLPVDVERFLALADEGLACHREGRLDAARAALQAADALYAGDFLEEDRYQDWAGALRAEARAVYISVARALGEAAVSGGDHDAAVRCYLKILAKDTFDEEAHLGLVAILQREGRHGEARRQYRAYTARMVELQVPAAPFPSLKRA